MVERRGVPSKFLQKYVSKPKVRLQSTHHLSFRQSNVDGHGTRYIDRRSALIPVNPVLHQLQDVQHHL